MDEGSFNFLGGRGGDPAMEINTDRWNSPVSPARELVLGRIPSITQSHDSGDFGLPMPHGDWVGSLRYYLKKPA